jgi:cyclase
MLKKRVIFTLLYDSGSFMLSRNFRLQKVGDLHWLQKNYNFSQIAFSIDELIILDVSRNRGNDEDFLHHVRALNEECFVPIAAGRGIRTTEQARRFFKNGADKVVVNSLLTMDAQVIEEIASEFGDQCIVASVDTKIDDDNYRIYTENGTARKEFELKGWLEQISSLPIGELYLNSIDRDGTGQGYLMELLDHLPVNFSKPLIMAGGAGNSKHFSEGLSDSRIDAVATAHLFNFVGKGLLQARTELINNGFHLAIWDVDRASSLKNIYMSD